MPVDVWEPAKSIAVSKEKLNQYLEILPTINFDALETELPETLRHSDSGLMKLQSDQWQAAEHLEDDELKLLVQFFTLAEMQIPNWDGGQTSPVIYLVKILKRRGAFDAELKRWIKASTDNRYLPNGAVLL